MNRALFDKKQQEGLKKFIDQSKSWWNEGPRYTLQAYEAFKDGCGRVYKTSIIHKGKIPDSLEYEGDFYDLDLETINKFREYPIHFVPYVQRSK